MKVYALLALFIAASVCDALYLPLDSRVKRDIDDWNTQDFMRDYLGQERRELYGMNKGMDDYAKRYLMSYPVEGIVNRPNTHPLMRTVGNFVVNRMRSPYSLFFHTLLEPNPAY
ncbi:uncharacterized protein LOC119458351 [Dermacentor silvarum]|uniref:uncharacterized protein LOC119458351 n=1 Tax=Dermacentor silvarum TaxID=543639 RepID=UPI001896FE14|nr:uncharacterized protein LOC119458351 [Dermacentor silvarum]